MALGPICSPNGSSVGDIQRRDREKACRVSLRYECVVELSTQTRQKRTRFDTIFEILQLCTETTKRTHIMFRINLSYAQLDKFISLLVHSGLLSVNHEGYTTTDKGRHFMEVYTELLSIFEGF